MFHTHPEIDYVRAEVTVAGESEVLATDVVGGVLWIDETDGSNNRQVILPDGEPARPASQAHRREQPSSD